ncbi:hypothetical protein BDV11DRAFT_889 [Aspergillus similis]
MRPRPFSLPCRAHLRSPAVSRRIPPPVCGARQYARTAEILNTNTFRRPTSAVSSSGIRSGQQRWITQAYIQRIEEGKKEWAQFAQEIKEGKRKSFVEHLEERGLIHDVVGCVATLSIRPVSD